MPHSPILSVLYGAQNKNSVSLKNWRCDVPYRQPICQNVAKLTIIVSAKYGARHLNTFGVICIFVQNMDEIRSYFGSFPSITPMKLVRSLQFFEIATLRYGLTALVFSFPNEIPKNCKTVALTKAVYGHGRTKTKGFLFHSMIWRTERVIYGAQSDSFVVMLLCVWHRTEGLCPIRQGGKAWGQFASIHWVWNLINQRVVQACSLKRT